MKYYKDIDKNIIFRYNEHLDRFQYYHKIWRGWYYAYDVTEYAKEITEAEAFIELL